MPSASYSRLGYLALKVESVENTAVKPDTFVEILKEDIVTKYDVAISMPVAANRVLNLGALPNAIAAPSGKLTINVEPKTFGHFLRGCYGNETVGRYVPISTVSGTFAVGELLVGATSSKTATIVAISSENDYILTGALSGRYALSETVFGQTSSATAVVGETNNGVYGHQFSSPQTSLPTYTVEIGYLNEAVRYTGVRFNELLINQKENIITADVGMFARAEFKHARASLPVTTGATKTITVDQTTGLVAGDTVKLYRPSTAAFQDFASSGVQTQTIVAVVSETTFTINNLQTAVVAGDLIILSPQTTSYNVANEFTWVGGSAARISDSTMSACLVATVENIEDFEVNLQNEVEERHAANGANVINRFPASNYLKGVKGSGKLHKVYTDMNFLDRLRKNRSMSLQVVHTGDAISASITNQFVLDLRAPSIVFDAFGVNIEEDALLDQEIPYTMFYNSTSGFFHKALLVNDISSY